MSKTPTSGTPSHGDPWPRRTAICVDCRMTVADCQQPHIDGHELVALRTENGRKRLLDRVWGEVEVNVYPVAPWASALSFISLAAIASGLVFTLASLNILLGYVLVVVGIVLRGVLGVADKKHVVARRSRLSAEPAAKRALLLAGSSATVGTVAAHLTGRAPLSGETAVAFSVTLSTDDGVTLTDGVTMGFALSTQDGETIDIPPGPIEIIGHGNAGSRDFAPSDSAVSRYLSRLDPRRRNGEGPDPFTCRVATETVVRHGDHLALHNPLKRGTFDDRSSATGYRELARRSLSVEGIPCIELMA